MRKRNLIVSDSSMPTYFLSYNDDLNFSFGLQFR